MGSTKKPSVSTFRKLLSIIYVWLLDEVLF